MMVVCLINCSSTFGQLYAFSYGNLLSCIVVWGKVPQASAKPLLYGQVAKVVFTCDATIAVALISFWFGMNILQKLG